ncbi:hypothetical protein Bca52824_028369 [Brassica carinata]|uniref:Uncharacterized protein n=1 Tax=Brassica carinata TaxID=52824 RepID=A0A8X7VCC6_BRACI|nr:hypothetical protein Bca52824_028369 [Brassica carinata]
METLSLSSGPFLRGYLKICQDVKDRRLSLFKKYFVEERKQIASSKATGSEGLKCAIDHILDAQQKGEITRTTFFTLLRTSMSLNFELLPPPGQSRVDTSEKGGQFSLHILNHSTIVMKPRTF